MAPVRQTTPPPGERIHVPDTPRFGGYGDDYQPYSPRKSSRLASRQTTPPNRRKNERSPSSSKKVASPQSGSSPLASSRKMGIKKIQKTSPTHKPGRKPSGVNNHRHTAAALEALRLPPVRIQGTKEMRGAATSSGNGMLITPAKTPSSPQTKAQVNPEIEAVARTLFATRGGSGDEVMPKKRGRKGHKGYTLDSFEAEEDQPIPIYTDSKDRVPEVDLSEDNPFYDPHPKPINRAAPSVREMTPREAARREDGMMVNFRGKYSFRKFDDETTTLGSRSSIEPRLLFQDELAARRLRSQATEDEEEATTDVEETVTMSTPKASRFGPASPPTTARATRSMDVEMIDELMGQDSSPTFSDAIASSSPGRSVIKKRGAVQTGGGRKKARG